MLFQLGWKPICRSDNRPVVRVQDCQVDGLQTTLAQLEEYKVVNDSQISLRSPVRARQVGLDVLDWGARREKTDGAAMGWVCVAVTCSSLVRARQVGLFICFLYSYIFVRFSSRTYLLGLLIERGRTPSVRQFYPGKKQILWCRTPSHHCV